MHIPISFNQRGKWKVDATEGGFPKEKPDKPHLYQGQGDTLRITNYEGKTPVIKVPRNSYLQLQDNREWNWGIFQLKGSTSFAPDRKELSLTITVEDATGKAAPLVDKLGQSAREDWPGKAMSIEELKGDVEAENAYYPGSQPPAAGTWGGMLGSNGKLGLKATNFFHIETKDGRSLLVDPAGDAFFHLGLCSAQPNEVEQSAALGFVVGIEWFTLIDQAVTGRWFQGLDGERGNTRPNRGHRPSLESRAGGDDENEL